MKKTPESIQEHCAALAKVRADRQMNAQYRLGRPMDRYDAAQAERAAERDCLETQKKREAEKNR
jgi:hypothetical protein